MFSNRIAAGAVAAGLAPFIVLGPSVALAEDVPATIVQQDETDEGEYEELTLPKELQSYQDAVDKADAELEQVLSDLESAVKEEERLGDEYNEISDKYQDALADAESAYYDGLETAYSDLQDEVWQSSANYDEQNRLSNAVEYLKTAYQISNDLDSAGDADKEGYQDQLKAALEDLETNNIAVEMTGTSPTTDELKAALDKTQQELTKETERLETASKAYDMLCELNLEAAAKENPDAFDALISAEELSAYKDALEALKTQAGDTKEKFAASDALYSELQEKGSELDASQEKVQALIDKQNDAFAKLEAAQDEFNAALEEYAANAADDTIEPVVDKSAPVSKVTVNTDLSDVKGIFDEDELYQIAYSDSDVSVELRVKEADLTEAQKKTALERLAAKAPTAIDPVFMDISLVKIIDDEESFVTNQLSRALSISVALPDDLKPADGKSRVYLVVRSHDGAIDILDAKYDAATGMLTFETDRFSSYGITYYEKDAEAETVTSTTTTKTGTNETSSVAGALPQTGDPFSLAGVAGAAVAGVAMIGAGKHFRRRDEE